MKLSRVFSNHSNLRLKNAVRAIRTGFLFDFVYCRWHNLIIRVFLFFCFGIYAKFEFNVQRVYLIIICVLFCLLFPSFGHVTHVYNLTDV